MILVADIGEDDDVGGLAERAEGVEGAGDEALAVHLAVEEGVEQRPDVLARHRRAITVGEAGRESRRIEREVEPVLRRDPVREMRREMEQHVVAVADQ
jgi:hypothetical protein